MNSRSTIPANPEESWEASLAKFQEQMAKHREESPEDLGSQFISVQTDLNPSQKDESYSETKTKKSADKKRTKSKSAKQESNTDKPKKSSKSKKKVKNKDPSKLAEEGVTPPYSDISQFGNRNALSHTMLGPAMDLEPFEDLEPDSEVDVVQEIKRVLEDNQTDEQVARQLQGYLQKLIASEKLAPESLSSPFWKPEELKNMTEVRVSSF